MGKIIAVNISEEKGTPKKNIHSANLIEDWGVEHDAHAGKMASPGQSFIL